MKEPHIFDHVKDAWPAITIMGIVMLTALRLWWEDRTSIGSRLSNVENIAITNKNNTDHIIQKLTEIDERNTKDHQFLIDKLIDKK